MTAVLKESTKAGPSEVMTVDLMVSMRAARLVTTMVVRTVVTKVAQKGSMKVDLKAKRRVVLMELT